MAERKPLVLVGGTPQELPAGDALAGTLPDAPSNGKTYGRRNKAWQQLTEPDNFPAGTVMLFVQTTAPVGWTKQTTHNNKALRVVSGTASSGGSVNFTTAFSQKSVSGTVSVSVGNTAAGGSVSLSGTVGNTTLSLAQMPVHNHELNYSPGDPTWAVAPGQSDVGRGATPAGHATRATGGGRPHNHSFTGSATFTGSNHSHSATGAFTGSSIDLRVAYVDVIIAEKD